MRHQTDKRFRVYIGDDCSPNDPKALLANYESDLNITYKRFEDNLGSKSLPKQWERCMDMTKDEEWFIILGDDDYFSTNYIEAFYENLDQINKHDCHVVRYATFIVDENNVKISSIFENPLLEKSTDFYFRKVQQLTRGSMSEFVYKKRKIQQI